MMNVNPADINHRSQQRRLIERIIWGPESDGKTTGEAKEWEQTKLYQNWSNRVKGQPANDFLVVIDADSRSAVSGTGKTSLAVSLAEKMDLSEDGFDASEKASVDASEMAYKLIPEVPAKSAVVFDESQGLPGSSGLDARRSMKTTNIDLINSVLGNRDKELTFIFVTQQFKAMDTRLYHNIDAWLHIKQGPSSGEPMGSYYLVHTNDFELTNNKYQTPFIENFYWEKLEDGNPNYEFLEQLKQQAKTRGSDEQTQIRSIGDLPIEERNKEIESLYDSTDATQQQLASWLGMDQSTISRILNGKSK